jgi:hypothetical protein
MSKALNHALMLALALALTGACGSKEPAAAPQPVVAPPPPAPATITMTARNGVVWRYTDNDWVVRATVTMTNGTPTAQAVARASFQLPGFTPWPSDADFPESTTLAPGQAVTGDLAWYIDEAQPQPTSLSIGYAGLASAVVPLVRAPAPVQHGQGLATPSDNIPLTVTGDAISWVHTDGDRCIRANVKIQNTSSGPLAIPRNFVQGLVGTTAWTGWSGGATMPDPIVLPPGQAAEGWVTWYTSGDTGVPGEVQITIGPKENTQRVTARVVAGPAPQ